MSAAAVTRIIGSRTSRIVSSATVSKLLASGAAVALLFVASVNVATAAPRSQTSASVTRYPRCSALNKRYPHGVGRVGARDHTSATPVTNFKRSNTLYRQNAHLDRDKDGIACEKA